VAKPNKYWNWFFTKLMWVSSFKKHK